MTWRYDAGAIELPYDDRLGASVALVESEGRDVAFQFPSAIRFVDCATRPDPQSKLAVLQFQFT